MKGNILVVDDEPIIRMDIKDILTDRGYNVVGEACDGFEAVVHLYDYKPQVNPFWLIQLTWI